MTVCSKSMTIGSACHTTSGASVRSTTASTVAFARSFGSRGIGCFFTDMDSTSGVAES